MIKERLLEQVEALLLDIAWMVRSATRCPSGSCRVCCLEVLLNLVSSFEVTPSFNRSPTLLVALLWHGEIRARMSFFSELGNA